MIQFRQYVKVTSIDEAYELNQKKSNVIVGGMHWLKMSSRSAGTAIDLSGLGLDKITETEDCFEIGCMASLRQLETHQGLNEYSNNSFRDAVKDIVGVQFRNTATVGGSVRGRFGFSDVLTVLLAFDTYVECYKAGLIPLADYAKAKRDRDIIVKIIIKKHPVKAAYAAQRRQRTDFPVLTCAVSNLGGTYRAVIGARPAKAVVVCDEKGILAQGINEETAQEFGEYVAKKLNYGSNIRGSAEYRKMITPVLVRRTVMAAKGEE